MILTRRQGESIVVNGNIEIEVHWIRKNKVEISITAPRHMTIDRKEVHLAKQAEIKRNCERNRQHANDHAAET